MRLSVLATMPRLLHDKSLAVKPQLRGGQAGVGQGAAVVVDCVGVAQRIEPRVNPAKFFDAELAVCDKYRKEANKIESMRLIGEVEGKDVILVDDLVDTAGTICKAAALLKEKGANSVRAVCTHAVMSGAAYENIQNSVLEEMAVTDTIPLKKSVAKVKVLSMSDLFAKAIRKIHDNESISSLFIRL